MINLESAKYSWELIAGLVALVAWFIRLEAKVLYLEKDHAEHKRQSEAKNAAFGEKLDAIQLTVNLIQQSLAKIEGKLESRRED